MHRLCQRGGAGRGRRPAAPPHLGALEEAPAFALAPLSFPAAATATSADYFSGDTASGTGGIER